MLTNFRNTEPTASRNILSHINVHHYYYYYYSQELGTHGKKGFYEGRVAKSIVNVVGQHGGLMTMEDLASHTCTEEDPISTDYKGCRVWEMPPNGQGMTALIALNILEGINLKGNNTLILSTRKPERP